ncbi:MAG: hypothetical protein HGA27_08850, partial [Peptococcaceae bacterium]|nr:hypothetical protein [Peptococcaceae bacterium]
MNLGLGLSILLALKVILFFIFIYIFIPSKIIHFSENDKFLDKVFISLTHSTLITVIIVHLLVFLKLY